MLLCSSGANAEEFELSHQMPETFLQQDSLLKVQVDHVFIQMPGVRISLQQIVVVVEASSDYMSGSWTAPEVPHWAVSSHSSCATGFCRSLEAVACTWTVRNALSIANTLIASHMD